MDLGRIDPNVVKALSKVPEVRRQVRKVAAAVRTEARRRAPKDTGAGAKSIRVTSGRDHATGIEEYRVSWDKTHFYLKFHELGSEHQPARPFLRPAAAAVQRGLVADPGSDSA